MRNVLFLLCLSMLLNGCRLRRSGGGVASDGARPMPEYVDSLNRQAYACRYRDVVRSQQFARQALQAARHYPAGQAEALNHIAYVRYQQMDFDGALQLVQRIRELTANQVELLVADIMGMKVCQRTSDNRDFFRYRNQAQQRLKRIAEEENSLPPHLQERLLFARTEYHIVSSTYYFYLEQNEQAREEINRVCPDADGMRDTAQWLYLYYMKGSGGLCEGATEEEVSIREFDKLFRCFTLSKSAGYVYFEGNSLQALAVLLHSCRSRERLRQEWPGAYAYLLDTYTAGYAETDEAADKALPAALARQALLCFKKYGDPFQTACALRTLGELRIGENDYAGALRYFGQALTYVNRHHRRYYPDADKLVLLPYRDGDTVSVEMQWMLRPDVKTVPEWIAGIREQLSVAFSGMDDKQKSDYNRNIYLDLLELTRQDKEWENRYEELAADTRALTLNLAMVVALVLLFAGVAIGMARRWRRYDAAQVARLRALLEQCRHVLGGEDGQEEPALGCDDETFRKVLQPYRAFSHSNRSHLQEIEDERRQVSEERRSSELRQSENKRKNVEKRAKMSLVHGIIPVLDRIIREVSRLTLSPAESARRLEYIRELADGIDAHNDVLTQWIQLRQGALSLHIERFALQPLFDVLRKGHYAFEQKGLTLQVADTEATVKADRSLTMFMINTLADNARKFTPAGGRVTLAAREEADYVEVSVTDTGCGLSEADCNLILTSKVYDAGKIGGGQGDRDARKGFGFGLLNCKGIIEKYRKTHTLFDVCRFGIESRPGQGSRFFFRLPRVSNTSGSPLPGLAVLLVLCMGCGRSAAGTDLLGGEASADSLQVSVPEWEEARKRIDSLYFANIDGRYEDALRHAAAVVRHINDVRRKDRETGADTLTLFVADPTALPAEVRWWEQGERLDYNLILGLRNETAVAALAVHDRDLYRYNNHAYTRLYKLLSRDTTLETYCRNLEQIRTNRRIGRALILLFALLTVIALYLLFFRKRLQFRFHLEQLLEVDKDLLKVAAKEEPGEDFAHMAEMLLQHMLKGLNEIHSVQALYAVLCDDEQHLLGYFHIDRVGRACPIPPIWVDRLEHVWREGHPIQPSADEHGYGLPLSVETGDGQPLCIGAIVIDTGAENHSEAEQLLDELVVNYLSVLLYQRVVRRQGEYETLEEAEYARARALYEEDKLHVQNMVLDNCLSTIKHESMYYPGRIRQMAARLAEEELTDEERRQQIDALSELTLYYKEIYTLLCAQADRQLAEPGFRRKPVSPAVLVDHAAAFFARRVRKKGLTMRLACLPGDDDLRITGDEDLLRLLMECVTDGALDAENLPEVSAPFEWKVEKDGAFARFRFIDPRPNPTVEDGNEWFAPSLHHIPYLMAKQIIREHDAFTNHCGCRICVDRIPDGGTCIWFTLPLHT